MTHQDWTLDALIEAYKQHQRRTRGLREPTLHGYERFARRFGRAALGDDPLDPTRVSPSDVIEFVASLRGRYSPGSMKVVCTALRLGQLRSHPCVMVVAISVAVAAWIGPSLLEAQDTRAEIDRRATDARARYHNLPTMSDLPPSCTGR
jgi:hypothetical protein